MNQHPIAYLCSEYPEISHTVIHREIETLCQSGMTFHTPTNIGMLLIGPDPARCAAVYPALPYGGFGRCPLETPHLCGHACKEKKQLLDMDSQRIAKQPMMASTGKQPIVI